MGPAVSIVMGSKSDLDVMSEAAKVLKDFRIPYEIRVISAHRTPDRAVEYGRGARERGVKVIIAGAGKAAHLPGVLAALTTIPVIGVPIETPDLGGLDSLLSIVQMPGGIPVATTSIGKHGAKNAGVLAAEILALSDPDLAGRLEEYRRKMARQVEEDDRSVAAGAP
ncbi:MAG: 5-(carboxyamino)imidazole ribonucleotide mutase [Planctomycetota bacterium]|nr:5-(carboxyamino)imidazole ribonucleotide mutase [Planctomycetota bacterium]